MITGQIAESMGLLNFYGWSPAIDFLAEESLKEKKSICVLQNDTKDIRHLIKTLADNHDKYKNIEEIEICVLEQLKECFARDVILQDIINNSGESFRERIELFFDVYWNCFVREKTSTYINSKIKDLQNLVTDTHKCQLVIKNLINFKEIKYGDRDELLDIFKSWDSKCPFNMDEYRDTRLRYHYKDRYDYRHNLIDWDYVWNLKEDASIIHYREYKDWRQNGNAFETRFSTYIIANRTMGAFVRGNRRWKDDHHLGGEKCLVRGFWGDIVNSPFWSFGIETDSVPEKEKLLKTTNYQNDYLSMHIAEFNVHNIIQRLEKGTDYHINFEKEAKKEEPIKKDLQEIEEDPDKEKEAEKEEQQEEEIQEKKQEKNANEENQPMDPSQEVEIDEKLKDLDESKKEITQTEDKIEREESKELLDGLKKINLKITPIFDTYQQLAKKKKFSQKFDVIVNGFLQATSLKDTEFKKIMKEDCIIYQETADFFVPIERKKRQEVKLNFKKNAVGNGLRHCLSEKAHHLKFIYNSSNPVSNTDTEVVAIEPKN